MALINGFYLFNGILMTINEYLMTHSHVELPIDVASLTRPITCQLHMFTSNL